MHVWQMIKQEFSHLRRHRFKRTKSVWWRLIQREACGVKLAHNAEDHAARATILGQAGGRTDLRSCPALIIVIVNGIVIHEVIVIDRTEAIVTAVIVKGPTVGVIIVGSVSGGALTFAYHDSD